MTFFEELQWRGLVKDVAGEDIADKLNNEKITFYWGTDPTADSLHLGHYSSLVTAKRLARAGHHPILLVGGSTGLIGDPRPTAEREIISHETLEKNLAGKVCMDQIMIDVTYIRDVKVGDKVLLFGKDDMGEISLYDLAEMANTNVYELLCRVTMRIPRIYTRNGKVVEVCDYLRKIN